ncbi:MAG: dynamin family protein [Synergistaceae bacterium]|nr:dynamin family protein [Synergistaceae bacterium]
MEGWDEAKQAFIEKLERQEKCFMELFERDKNGIVIGFDERRTLEALRARNSAVLSRLKSREFAVAVVGLEKAGKSTLGNALINSEILPEYTERCTYTTTELRAGDKNEAEVTFYSEAEFTAIFREMLQSVGYDGSADFRTLAPETFAHYWEAVGEDSSKRDLYERHNGKTDEDILTILRGSKTIAELLGQPVRKFMYDSGQGSSEFQLYITGISGYDDKGAAVRTAHPYAVKNVVIRSTELGDMRNIVLYDVPGFDSTTELHKKQTEQMLKEADAIILVTNVGDRPNINSPQLDMLRKVRDQDGVKLRDKTFIFGNKIDMAGNEARARDNDSALRSEAERYQVAQAVRVISGSAKAYLEGLGLLSPDEIRRGKINAKARLDEWGMPDGVTELHRQLQDYYNNDRFEVLRRRAETTITATVEFLRTLLAKYSPEVLDRLETGGKYMLQLRGKADTFARAAMEISSRYSSQIISTRPFSTQLAESIERIYPLTEEFRVLIDEVIHQSNATTTGIMQLSAINAGIRGRVHIMFMENLVREAANIVENKQAGIRAELVSKFLEIMGMREGSEYEAELVKSVNALFDEYLIKDGEECRFNTLIERFASGLVETLILMPFAEFERLETVKKTLPELFSLAVYYSMPEIDGSFEVRDSQEDRRKFFAKILAHEGGNTQSSVKPSAVFAAKGVLIDWFDRHAKVTGLSVNELPIDEWAVLFAEKGEKLETMPDDLAKQLKTLDLSSLNKTEKVSRIDGAIRSFLGGTPENAQPLDRLLDSLHAKASAMKARNTDDMLKILDEDIMILRDLTTKSVIRAIGLELAFTSIIVKNINFIRRGITDAEGSKNFDEWINLNVRKVLDSEFAAIDRYNMDSQTRKSIISAIQQVLGSME